MANAKMFMWLCDEVASYKIRKRGVKNARLQDN